MSKKGFRIKARLRLWAIYNETGMCPWHKPKASRKKGKRVYMGAAEAIPFMNDDGKRTLSHLLLRPGYMMRDYILRGDHERYFAPFTALLVFYSFFTLVVAIAQPGSSRKGFGDGLLEGIKEVQVEADSTHTQRFAESLFRTVTQAVLITHLDLYPEAADTPWKESLAAVEGEIRSKGIPLFLGNFLLLWLAFALLLRKYGVSVSGAAAASAYVLCQFCIFMFLALLFTLGQNTELGMLIMGVLLFIDFRQMFAIGNRESFWLTVRTGVLYLAFSLTFYLLLGGGLVLTAFIQAG